MCMRPIYKISVYGYCVVTFLPLFDWDTKMAWHIIVTRRNQSEKTLPLFTHREIRRPGMKHHSGQVSLVMIVPF